ncbi:unnamed protein product [Rhizoctonia solani]|uniref:F-box domain-containing protein n=1 Tax=Rhizoctonia solani TaxID=456999 RepID=A0A8H2XGA1_9AGAM|nr:unnamed protein product [Rhizoctonia solani]
MQTRSMSKSAKRRRLEEAGALVARPPPPIMRLPPELLSEIFIYAVYGPEDNDVMAILHRRIESIYQRVHTLLAVCTTWRSNGHACHALWTTVPIADHNGHERPLSTRFSLQRAGGQGLHLAISAWRFSSKRFEALKDHWHRFTVINIWSDSGTGDEINETLRMIIKHSPPESISALSLRQGKRRIDLFERYPLAHLEPEISRRIGLLSAFRVGNMNIDWARITFSHRLVELRIADQELRNDMEVTAFFVALSSAHELKELKLISSVFRLNQLNTTIPPGQVSLPKLEHLHLERLHFNVLKFLLSSIASGPYRLTLNLYEEVFLNRFPVANTQMMVTKAQICEFLKGVPIHKLILWGNVRFFWSTRIGLRCLLKSVPGLKTLVLNYFDLGMDLLPALKQPPAPKSVARETFFPILTRLDIHGAWLDVPLADLKPEFKDVLRSHHIQQMIFGGTQVRRFPWGIESAPLDASDEVFGWLKRNIPKFTVSCKPEQSPEATDMWRLWDI